MVCRTPGGRSGGPQRCESGALWTSVVGGGWPVVTVDIGGDGHHQVLINTITAVDRQGTSQGGQPAHAPSQHPAGTRRL